jgi:periplasmic divalent cation tolerance protein
MSNEETDAVVVLMTTPTREEAVRIAEMLIGSRLAACVQIMPEMESIYHWQETIQRDAEFLLLAKTTSENLATLEYEVRALHSYKVPEIVAIPAIAVSNPYLNWLKENVRRHNAQAG